MVVAIQERMQVLARIPPGHGEPLQAQQVCIVRVFPAHAVVCMQRDVS